MKAKVIVVANQKGGTGKTTTAVTLAGLLSLTHRNVLLIDCDPQGQGAVALGMPQEAGVFHILINPRTDIHQHIRMTGRTGFDLLPGDRTTATAQIVINAENRAMDAIAEQLDPLRSEYHYILLDTAPSVGGIQERAVYAADYVLIPTSTEFMSSNGLMQMLDSLKQLVQRGWQGKLLGILPTFFDDVSNESKNTMQELKEQFGEVVLDPIHRATLLRECCAEGKLVYEMDPQHRATREYTALTNYIIKNT